MPPLQPAVVQGPPLQPGAPPMPRQMEEDGWVVAVEVPGAPRRLLPPGAHSVGSSLTASVFVPHPHVAALHATLHVRASREVWVEAHDSRTQVGVMGQNSWTNIAPGPPAPATGDGLLLGPAALRLWRRTLAQP